jgi:hypothetical protein
MSSTFTQIQVKNTPSRWLGSWRGWGRQRGVGWRWWCLVGQRQPKTAPSRAKAAWGDRATVWDSLVQCPWHIEVAGRRTDQVEAGDIRQRNEVVGQLRWRWWKPKCWWRRQFKILKWCAWPQCWCTGQFRAPGMKPYIHRLTDKHTSLCMLVTSTLPGFGTEEYIRVIFLGTGEYIKTEEDTLFSCSVRWKAEDHRLRRSGSVMCQAGTSKVVTPVCVS